MSDRYDCGPLQTWQLIWKSGHVEEVQGHQVLIESASVGGIFGGLAVDTAQREPRIRIHGEIDGRWRLVLSALESEITTIRLMRAGVPLDGAL